MTGISYIITLYNKAPFVPYMLSGLASQIGDFPKEFIFINDGSTDDSMAIVREKTAGWDNIIMIDQDNQGPAIATNRAVARAQYPYLKMVDGDDVLAPYAGKLMQAIAQKTAAGAVYSYPAANTSHINYENGIQFLPEPALDDLTITTLQDTLFHVLRSGWSGSSNLLVERDAFLAVGGCDEQVFVQDWSLPLRIAAHYPIVHFPHLIVYGPNNATGRVMGNHPQMIHDLTATQYHFMQSHPALSARYRRLAAKRCTGRAWKWAKRENQAGFRSKYFWLYLANRLQLPLNPLWQMAQSQQVFYDKHTIRLPQPSQTPAN